MIKQHLSETPTIQLLTHSADIFFTYQTAILNLTNWNIDCSFLTVNLHAVLSRTKSLAINLNLHNGFYRIAERKYIFSVTKVSYNHTFCAFVSQFSCQKQIYVRINVFKIFWTSLNCNFLFFVVNNIHLFNYMTFSTNIQNISTS